MRRRSQPPHGHDPPPRPPQGPGALTVRQLAGRAGLRLEGEADFAAEHQIREALAALPPAAKIHLDLAGLKFIDVAATRQLIAVTQQPSHPRLILHDPPPVLIRIIRLAWPEANLESARSPGEIPEHNGEAPRGINNRARREPLFHARSAKDLIKRLGNSSPAATQRYLHAVDGRDAEIASAVSDLAAHGNAARLPKSIVIKH
jgi:hypothetical protein